MKKNINIQNQGIVYSVTDGIILISGMRNATAGDMITINGKYKNILGMVFNLDQDFVSAVLFGREEEIQEGSTAVRNEALFSVKVGLWMFRRVLNGIREAIDTGETHKETVIDVLGAVETRAPNIISRTPVNVPLMTGIKAVNALISIGHGQRELKSEDSVIKKIRKNKKAMLKLLIILFISFLFCITSNNDLNKNENTFTYTYIEPLKEKINTKTRSC